MRLGWGLRVSETGLCVCEVGGGVLELRLLDGDGLAGDGRGVSGRGLVLGTLREGFARVGVLAVALCCAASGGLFLTFVEEVLDAVLDGGGAGGAGFALAV